MWPNGSIDHFVLSGCLSPGFISAALLPAQGLSRAGDPPDSTSRTPPSRAGLKSPLHAKAVGLQIYFGRFPLFFSGKREIHFILGECSCRDVPTSTQRDKPEPRETQGDKHNRSQSSQASALLRSDVCRAWH